MIIDRRDFLRAMLVAAAGPMIVRASSLMPIRAPKLVSGYDYARARWIVTRVTTPEGLDTPYGEVKLVPLGGPLNYGGGIVYSATTWAGFHGYKVGDIVELGKAPPAEASEAFPINIKIT